MIKVAGTGSYLPEKILTNYDLEKIVDTTDEWIFQRTGIKERRIASKEESTSDMATNAARNALAMANMSPKDIEFIIVGTSTPDYQIPACAPIIQAKLGCNQIPAIDLNSVCTSFTFAFLNGYSLIKSGLYNNCLIIGSDTYSRILNWKDRTTCVIFADGAGAMILKKDEIKKGILSYKFGCDGEGSNLIRIPLGGAKNPIHSIEEIKNNSEDDLFFQMDGKKVYEFTISVVPETITLLLENAKLSKDDISHYILHQANIRIIDTISKNLKIPYEKFIINIDKVGNTSSASIPIAIDQAYREGRIKSGDIVLILGFGGGLSWGGCIFEW